jgi:hypothetical protein
LATTGELQAIIEELQLVDIGDAADYLGEGSTVVEALSMSAQIPLPGTDTTEHPAGCDCAACQA